MFDGSRMGFGLLVPGTVAEASSFSGHLPYMQSPRAHK